MWACSVPCGATANTPSGTITKSITLTITSSAPTALHYTTPVVYTKGEAITANKPNPEGGVPAAVGATPAYSITSGRPVCMKWMKGSFWA